jgi:hypothetical protein
LSRTLSQIDQALLQLETFVGNPEIYQGYGSTLQEALIRYSDLLYYDISLFNPNSLIVGYFGQVEPQFRLPFERLNIIPRNDFTTGPASVTLMRNPEQYFGALRNASVVPLNNNGLAELINFLDGPDFSNEFEDLTALLLIEEPIDNGLYYTNVDKLFYRYDALTETFVIELPVVYQLTEFVAPTWAIINGEIGRVSVLFATGFSSIQQLETLFPNGAGNLYITGTFIEEDSVFFIQDLTSLTGLPVLPESTLNVVNDGSGAYVINGSVNPTITVVRGETYTFNINAVGHPFNIQSTTGVGGTLYNVGVTNNSTADGVITWIVDAEAPSELYYACSVHGTMQGTFNVVDAQDLISTSQAVYGDLYSWDPAINEYEKIGHTYPVVRIDNDNVVVNHAAPLWQKDYLYKLYYVAEAGIGNAFVLYGHDLSEFEGRLGGVTTWLGDFPDPLIVSSEYFEDIGRRFGLQLDVNYATIEPGVEDTQFIRDQVIINPNAAGDPVDSLIAEGLRSKSFLWSKHFRDNGVEGNGIVSIDNATLNLNTITNVVLPNFGSYAAMPAWMLINKQTYEAETSGRINTVFNEKFVANIFTPLEYETTANVELPNGTIYLQLEIAED